MAEDFSDTFKTLLRKLERHYVKRAAGLFRKYKIPEPARLPEPTPRDPPTKLSYRDNQPRLAQSKGAALRRSHPYAPSSTVVKDYRHPGEGR